MKVDYIIKNKVSEQQFETTVYDWLSDGDYTPDDIIENIITVDHLLYLAVHHYKSLYKGNVSAMLGYKRWEYYTVYNSQTKREETRSREVTDWKSYHSPVEGNISQVVYAGEKEYDKLTSFVEGTGWTNEELVPLDANTGQDSKFINKYTLNRIDCWNSLGIKKSYDKACSKILFQMPPRDNIKGFNANLNFNLTYQASIILPFWVFKYTYKEKDYYVSVDGNNPNRVDGVRPENKKRKYTVIAIRWIGWISTIFLAWVGASGAYEKYKNSDYHDLIAIGTFIVLFSILGFIVQRIIRNIKTESKQRRQEKLAKMRENKLTQTNS